MLSCTLPKIIYNNWLQVSKNRGGDLYVAAVDKYIAAFLQVVAYYQFLQGGVDRVGPSKEKLKLKFAQHNAEWSGNPSVLQKALFNMSSVEEFRTCNPYN